MKITPFLTLLFCLNVLISHPARAQDADTNTADFNFVLVPADKVLDIYKKITKSELVMLTDIPQQNRWITLHVVVPRDEVPQTLPKLLEQALLKQANVVLTRLDDKQVSVAYDKFDFRSDIQKAKQTPPLIITLTSTNVQTNSVRLITTPTARTQNVVFRYVNKSPEEIEALAFGISNHRAQIMKDGVVAVESFGYVALSDRQLNGLGLNLLFTNYDQAKLAEQTLRGN